jgi:uncharacterized protein with FMN-binding domain
MQAAMRVYKNFLTKCAGLVCIIGILWATDSFLASHNAQKEAVLQNRQEEEERFGQEIKEAIAQGAAAQNETEQAQVSPYADGVYEGSGTGFGGEVRVQVTVADGEIEEVSVLSADKEDKAYFDMAVVLLDEIVQEQSVEIDTVSGATYSSNGILDAAADALKQAEKQ